MKRVLNIFTRAGDEHVDQGTPSFREPTLYSTQATRPAAARPAPAARQMPPRKEQTEQSAPSADSLEVPLDYAGIVAFFKKTVSDRKSPFNALVQAADRLQEFIPDEIGRLKAAYALCGDKWPREVLALAIQNHIADLDNVCVKAKRSKSARSGERALQLRAESANLKQQNGHLQSEIDMLSARLAELQARFDVNQSQISELEQQAQLIEGDANSVTFLEQAAENLKSDLLAKKVLLGLS